MSRTLERGVVIVATVLTLVFFVLPVAYLVSVSFKTPDDVLSGDFLPGLPTLANWPKAFEVTALAGFIGNSVLISLIAGLLTVAVTLPAVYATTRLGYQAKWLPGAVLSSYVAPPVVALIPLFYLMKACGLINSTLGLTLLYALMNVPVAYWLLSPFLRQVPAEIEEAAALDGAGPVQTFLRIILPVVSPGVLATLIIAIILAYDEFLLGSALTFSDATRTLPVGISLFQGERLVNFGQMAAASLAGIAPIYLLALIGQRWLIQGLALGGSK